MIRLWHLVRADFLERARRMRFLVTLGAVVWLGLLASDGTISLQLGPYRGVLNSAWVGAQMALVATVFLGLAGFYLVKGTVTRDRDTGVGQVLAATPLSRFTYLLGKWLSNALVLGIMIAILAVIALGLQLWSAEATGVDLWQLVAPFMLIALPAMAVIAALAVLFDVIPWLRGSAGNVFYFFVWSAGMVLSTQLASASWPALDLNGLSLFMTDMGAVLRVVAPDYDGGLSLGATDAGPTQTFTWPGLVWSADIVAARLVFFVIGLALIGLAALVFDRFAQTGPVRRPTTVPARDADQPPAEGTPWRAQTLPGVRRGAALPALVLAELRLALRGQRWWWYGLGLVAIIAPLVIAGDGGRMVSAVAYLWPLGVWSGLGSRASGSQVLPLALSGPHPVVRQLPAIWLAGVLLTGLVTAGAGVQAGLQGGLLTWAAGVAFIPTLALCAGLWTGSGKLFEVLYLALWYVGLLNGVQTLNFVDGPVTTGLALVAVSIALGLLAVVARQRHLRGAGV